MKKVILLALIIVVAAGSFLAGKLSGWHSLGGGSEAAAGRKVLYYVDPMNPAHTSDKPGKAPCGMDMEPVYADLSLTRDQGAGADVMKRIAAPPGRGHLHLLPPRVAGLPGYLPTLEIENRVQ